MGFRDRPTRLTVWLLAVVAAVAGCTTGGEHSVRVLSTAELECDLTITLPESARASEGYRWLLDAVALPGPDIHHEIGRTDPATGLGFAKMGLLVKPGRDSTITVAPDQQAEIRLLWSQTADSEPPAERFVIPACEGDDEFLIYSGGVWISEPACVELTVEAGGQNESIMLPIETDCP